MRYQETFGTKERVITDLIKFEPPEMEYSMSKVPIGYIKGTDQIYCIDMNRSVKILIIGGTGSGKTVLTLRIMTAAAKSGIIPSVFDLKGEYIYMDKPLEDKFAVKKESFNDGSTRPKFLLPTEVPQGFPIKIYFPFFLWKLRENKDDKKDNDDRIKLCQFNLDSLDKTDFFTFFEPITKGNTRYFDLLEDLWNGIKDNDLGSWEEIIDYIEESELFDKISKKTITRTLRILSDNNIVGDMYETPDIANDIAEGKISILDLKGMLKLPAAVSPALVYTKILLRKIYDAKHDGVISKKVHNLINIDEVGKFVPRLGESPSRDEFLKLLDLVRSERISLIYAAQDWKRIPDTLIKQADYVFLSYNCTMDDLGETIKMLLPGEYQVPQTYKSKIGYIQNMMKKYKDGRRDWLVIDKKEKTRYFIRPVLPLCHFQQEEDEN